MCTLRPSVEPGIQQITRDVYRDNQPDTPLASYWGHMAETFTTRSGLPSNAPYSLLKDRRASRL